MFWSVLAAGFGGATRSRLRTALFLLLFASFSLPMFSQNAVRIQQAPFALQSGAAKLIGPYALDQKLRLIFGLQPPHMGQEEQLLRELQDTNSPQFHKYLSAQEWNDRFAPSTADEQSVVDWARSQGLTITQRYPNRLLVDVEAPVAVIEKALGVTINRYQLGDKSFFSSDQGPLIPGRLAGTVHSVVGPNNIEVMHHPNHGQRDIFGPDYAPGPAFALGEHLQRDGNREKLEAAMEAHRKGSDPFITNRAFDPTDIYASTAYDYAALANLNHCCNPLNNPNGAPREASIAVAIWNDFDQNDLIGFLTTYPYLASNVQKVFVDGTPMCCDGEATLDTEWTTATANSFSSSTNTAKVYVYEGVNGNDTLDVLNRILTDNLTRVVNMSCGGAEVYEIPTRSMDMFHAVFNQLAGQGWTLVAASGDSGATDDCADHLSVNHPASDPEVTAVGGTNLVLGSSEVAWSGGPYGCLQNDGGTGGGCSTYYAAPSYQTSPACGTSSRSVPDIALNSDWVNSPQNFYFQGALVPTGGTSIASPEMAGFAAQENAYLLYLGNIVGNTCGAAGNASCVPMGNANVYLYAEGLNQPFAAHYPFYDTTTGCNGNDITQQYGLTPFCAGYGYDMVTGWGSANMLQLAWTVNTYLAGDFGAPTITLSGPPANRWYNSDQVVNWTITDTTTNGHPPNGIAGFSAAWDYDPGDDYSEATPGSGNSFYAGPQSPNATRGSLNLSAGGLGCHTLNVRAWDNAGQPTADSIYGPLCYDTVPPVTTVTLNGTLLGSYYVLQVQVTLTAIDDLSGVASTMYQIDSSGWNTYTGPFVVTALGPHTLTFYSTDNAGNVETPKSTQFVVIGTTRNTLTVSKIGGGTGTVTSIDGGINCGSVCSNRYYDGTPVTLSPWPAQGSEFTNWAGCNSQSQENCTAVVLSDITVTATFVPATALRFVPVTPCRVVDTRNPNGEFGGPPIQGGTYRNFAIPDQLSCGIPSSAAAYSLNVTVVPIATLRYLTVWPAGQAQPVISTLNSPDGEVKANAAIVPAGTNEAISVYATDTTQLVLDINGYFVSDSSQLAFFPLAPCRVADTRNANGALGGPSLLGRQERDFPILTAISCNIPSSAQAYSLNFTVVPKTDLGFLTVWPYGQNRPLVSTLNDLAGKVLANAAVVPSGTSGEIAVYPSDDTDLVIDVNGYFAPANSGQNPLSLYTLLPCRPLDTRLTTGAFDGLLTPSANIAGSFCAVPSAQGAYVLNATVVPQGSMGYLTLWPDGTGQPVVSTLNAVDGAITSNMAIVPTSNGIIDAYAQGTTNLILDIFSYFAP